MSPIPESEVDRLILSSAHTQRQKVAMIIARVMGEAERRGTPVDENFVGGRIRALVQSKRLEAQGELWMWRQSEVKLPA